MFLVVWRPRANKNYVFQYQLKISNILISSNRTESVRICAYLPLCHFLVNPSALTDQNLQTVSVFLQLASGQKLCRVFQPLKEIKG